MAGLILPKRRLVLPPPPGTPIDSDSRQAQGLVGFWPLWGDINDYSIVKNNSVVQAGNPGLDVTSLGYSSSFNGSSQYLKILDNDYYSITSNGLSITFDLYLNALPPASDANRMWLVTKGKSGNYEWDISINKYNSIYGVVNVDTYNAGGTGSNNTASALTLSAKTWYSIAVVIQNQNATAAYNIYINGSFDVGSSYFSGVTQSNTSSDLFIGAREDLIEKYLNGYIRNVRIYNKMIDSDVELIKYNPYGIFWQPKRMFFIPGVRQRRTLTALGTRTGTRNL